MSTGEGDPAPSSPTTDISECLEALRLAVGGENQSKNTDDELYDQNGQKQHEETEETHLQQQIELIETIKHQVIGNHDNPAVADSTPSVPDQPLYTLPHLTHQLIEEQQLQPQYHRTCRQEACYYPNDITVDELAGYLDELLYLPQPMSDMAELMYT